MKLRNFCKRIRPEDCPELSAALNGGLEVAELDADQIAGLSDTVYLKNDQSMIYGKISRDILLYLILRQQEFHFSQILDSMNDGVIAVDAAGRIFYANSAYVQILGVPLRRIMGKFIQDVEPGSLLNRALLKKTAYSSERQLIPSIKKHVALNAVPLWRGEEFLGAFSVFRDVTRLYQLDREARQMSGLVDDYSQKLYGQETADRMGVISYNRIYQTTIQKASTVALTDVPLLVSGESGTGKSVMARYLHMCSGRQDKPFITVNCAALPESMMEQEIFGAAFGGEAAGGKFALADGGTLFLDEIGELSMPAQARLLGALQRDETEHQEPMEPVPDVRLIASCSQSLEQLVREKRFRQDLFFKLSVIIVDIPPLRDRREDIIPMANRFLAECNKKYRRSVVFSSQVYQSLRKYGWPGNLRELRGYVERAVILSDGELPVFDGGEEPSEVPDGQTISVSLQGESLEQLTRDFERKVFQKTLQTCHGNRSAAMQALQLSRRTFYRKCAELSITNSAKK